MAFQPFGFPFEVRSTLPAAKSRAAIRSRLKGWFDVNAGARGWIVGPIVCLWWTAFDRFGPMLIGWISQDGGRVRVRGRAGSDLNGALMLCLLVPVMALIVRQWVRTDGYSLQLALAVSVVLVVTPLALWNAHLDRREARPLVRFLEHALAPAGRAGASGLIVDPAFILTVDGEDRPGVLTADDVREALLGLGEGGFLILASAREIYIQTKVRDGDFILEKREGSVASHVHAVRRDGGSPRERLSFEETLSALLAFASGTPAPGSITWERRSTKPGGAQ